MTIPAYVIEQLQSSIAGQPAWGLSRGVGSFLTIEIGPAGTDGQSTGGWHLWVYMADWRFEQGEEILVGSADVGDFIDDALSELGPLIVESATIEGTTGDTAFIFSGGLKLVVFASALPSDDSEAWILTQPDGTSLSVGPANGWALEASKS